VHAATLAYRSVIVKSSALFCLFVYTEGMKANDVISDLDAVLSEFSTAEKRLYEQGIRAQVQAGKIAAVTVDAWENLPFPTVRHIFYGFNESQARFFLEEHKENDLYFRNAFKGAYKDLKVKNALPRVRQVGIAEVLSDAAPSQRQPGSRKQMLRGTK